MFKSPERFAWFHVLFSFSECIVLYNWGYIIFKSWSNASGPQSLTVLSFSGLLRALQRVPPPLPQPGHLWGVHDADHPREHLPVGHPQPPHQAGHLAAVLAAALRPRRHALHLRGWKVRLGWDGGGVRSISFPRSMQNTYIMAPHTFRVRDNTSFFITRVCLCCFIGPHN